MTGKKCLYKTLALAGPCRKLQNQDPPNQHLAKENENVSWTAKKLCHHYGSMGCRVFKRGVQNWKDFCIKINIPKENY